MGLPGATCSCTLAEDTSWALVKAADNRFSPVFWQAFEQFSQECQSLGTDAKSKVDDFSGLIHVLENLKQQNSDDEGLSVCLVPLAEHYFAT